MGEWTERLDALCRARGWAYELRITPEGERRTANLRLTGECPSFLPTQVRVSDIPVEMAPDELVASHALARIGAWDADHTSHSS